MRFAVWDKPRIIGCAENFPNHIALPRGCLDAARELLQDNGIRCDLCHLDSLEHCRGSGTGLNARMVQFPGVSCGSLSALETQLELAMRLGYLEADTDAMRQTKDSSGVRSVREIGPELLAPQR